MSGDIYKIFIDTNILYSKTLRDWILLLSINSENSFFQVTTSQSVLDEYAYHWRRDHPTSSDAARVSILSQIRKSVFTVLEGYEVPNLENYPDKDDLHVHAGCSAGQVNALITNDQKLLEFGRSETGEEVQNYETLSADGFLMQLTDYAPIALFLNTYIQQEKYLSKRYSDFNILSMLENAGASQFANYLKQEVLPRIW